MENDREQFDLVEWLEEQDIERMPDAHFYMLCVKYGCL